MIVAIPKHGDTKGDGHAALNHINGTHIPHDDLKANALGHVVSERSKTATAGGRAFVKDGLVVARNGLERIGADRRAQERFTFVTGG